MRLISLAVLLSFGAAAIAAEPPAKELVGSWQLVAAIPSDEQESSPTGVRNYRLRIGGDGSIRMVDPTQTLAEAKPTSPLHVEGKSFTHDLGEDGERHGAATIVDANTVEVKWEASMTWTLARIDDKVIESQRLPAESVEFMPPVTSKEAAAFKYDAGDYSKLPDAERLVGQWDVVEISGYGAGDFPPYGAPNETWTYDGKLLTVHDRYHPEDPQASEVHVVDGTLLGKGGAVPYKFDEWGRLVIESGGMRTVLKRINRDGKGKAVMPPLRIILGYARGGE